MGTGNSLWTRIKQTKANTTIYFCEHRRPLVLEMPSLEALSFLLHFERSEPFSIPVVGDLNSNEKSIVNYSLKQGNTLSGTSGVEKLADSSPTWCVTSGNCVGILRLFSVLQTLRA